MKLNFNLREFRGVSIEINDYGDIILTRNNDKQGEIVSKNSLAHLIITGLSNICEDQQIRIEKYLSLPIFKSKQ